MSRSLRQLLYPILLAGLTIAGCVSSPTPITARPEPAAPDLDAKEARYQTYFG